MGKQSIYGIFSYKRLQRQKRTISINGAKEDDGKWYHCWYCGFMNNIDRNAIGSGEGLSYSGGFLGVETHTNSMLNNGGKSVLLNKNPDFYERHNIGSDAVSGCSFCGCKNYR